MFRLWDASASQRLDPPDVDRQGNVHLHRDHLITVQASPTPQGTDRSSQRR